MEHKKLSEQALLALAERIEGRLSPYRMTHTKGVEEMAARLADLYCPEKKGMLRAAALLHDLTKEYTNEQQLALLEGQGIALRPDERETPKIWHAMTAPAVIERDFPDYADSDILSAVRWHTTGREGMTLAEGLLYLADFIEEGRTFPDCVALRRRFFDARPEDMTREQRARHLRDVLLFSFDMTLNELAREGRGVCLDTLAAQQYLKSRKEID